MKGLGHGRRGAAGDKRVGSLNGRTALRTGVQGSDCGRLNASRDGASPASQRNVAGGIAGAIEAEQRPTEVGQSAGRGNNGSFGCSNKRKRTWRRRASASAGSTRTRDYASAACDRLQKSPSGRPRANANGRRFSVGSPSGVPLKATYRLRPRLEGEGDSSASLYAFAFARAVRRAAGFAAASAAASAGASMAGASMAGDSMA